MATVRNLANGFDPVDRHFYSYAQSIAPATRHETITKSDTLNFTYPSREIYIGTGGVVAAVKIDGTVQNFTVPDGGSIPGTFIRINSTNTTASNMVSMS